MTSSIRNRWVGRSFISLFLIVTGLELPISARGDVPPPSSGREDAGPSVTQSLQSLVVQDEVEVRIAAHEPHVVDPIAARFDEHGRMWVVEMRDYPTGPLDGKSFDGRIVVLSDENNDGLFERSVTFADGLAFPTGLQPWAGGVIVTLAGRIEFMVDADSDGRCDHREVWFEGFDEGNEQLRANHPTLGPDGRIVVANGLRGGEVRSADARWDNGGEAIDLHGKDFAFDPRGGFFGAVAGNSQFGLSIDDFGNRVGCSNRNPAIETVFTLDEIDDDRWSVPADALHDIARAGAESDVRAIAQAWTTSHTHAGQFSAACGVTVGLGDALPQSWRDDLIVCEPTAYAVQRQRIRRDGVGRSSIRVDGPRELIASENTWFRPVDTTLGPDGALYVIDMCRAVIEHPDWAPEELKHRPDERYGNQLGRIWRIAETGRTEAVRNHEAELLPTTTAEWVKRLDHPNPVQRQFATAHLMRAEPNDVVQALRLQMSDSSQWTVVGYARALWLLQIHDAVDVSLLRTAAEHSSAEIRRLAVRLMAGIQDEKIPRRQLTELVISLLDDPDEWVRFDAAGLASRLASDANQADGRGDWVDRAAQKIAMQGVGKASDAWWTRRLAMSSPPLCVSLLRELSKFDGTQSRVRSLARRLAFADDRRIDSASLTVDDVRAIAFSAGWCEGRNAADQRTSIREESSPSGTVWRLIQQSIDAAPGILSDPAASHVDRINSLDVIEAFNVPQENVLRMLARQSADERLQTRALVNLLASSDVETIQWLAQNIAALSPPVRTAAIDQCLRTTTTASMLLDWVEAEQMPIPLLSIQQTDRLQRSSDASVASRAKKLFGSARLDRQNVLQEYAESTRGVANMVQGQALFTQHCAACHRIADTGIAVGPDISDSRTKTPDSLLASILDPNAAIDAGFLAYQALSEDGNLMSGMLIDSDTSSVTLQLAGGERHRLRRDELELFQTNGVSLMPDGFERSITPDQMRDLLGYLKGWRYLNETRTTIDLSQTAR